MTARLWLHRTTKWAAFLDFKALITTSQSSIISRIHPEIPCTVIFSEKEWKAAHVAIHKSSPETVPTLREMLIMVARLGGYLNRKNDPEPGAKVIWRGLEY